jgi:hypothetical protein
MKKRTKAIIICGVMLAAMTLLSVPALAVTEDQVNARVAETSKEAVSGNVFIWFLCAIAFLKISQKIDSFMSSLGINVGHTGGNMLAEALIATRGISEGKRMFGGGSGSGGSSGGASAAAGKAGFMAGGLAGAVSRQWGKSSASAATNQGGNPITRSAFQSSMSKGGSFANSIISSVAQGDIRQIGSITGSTADTALTSYMGETGKPDAPAYSNVEIGGGRIMGTETTAEHPGGIQFGMYNTEQYTAPDNGGFETVSTADGAKWYKQYAADTVEKTPYTAANGTVAYNEAVVRKLPPVPRRKDRV